MALNITIRRNTDKTRFTAEKNDMMNDTIDYTPRIKSIFVMTSKR